MSLNGILSSGLSAILTSSTAMQVASENIANVDTPDYVRRVANQETLAPGGILAGVEISSIQRATNSYLDNEVLSASASSAQYDTQSNLISQLNSALGQPGDGTSIEDQLDSLYSAVGQASVTPGMQATNASVINSLQSLSQSISGVANSVASLQQTTDGQISSTVSQANTLIQEIYSLNPQIQNAMISGDTSTGLLDQRDQLVQQLSQIMDIKTTTKSDGAMSVTTGDGVSLVGDNYAQLSYNSGSGSSTFNPITIQTINGVSGQPIGSSQDFDSHVSSGQLGGLLDLRDNVLVGVGQELGSLTQTITQSLNAASNASSASPPPTSLTGRDTGLLSTDSLNFTGSTNFGITDSSGNLLHNISVDFDNDTLSVDGGTATSFDPSVGGFTDALNTALGSNGSASFSNGVLNISATGSDGVVVSDNAGDPSSRGGVGFSQYFGLNDIFQTAGNSLPTTGLSASDTAGFNAGGSISLELQGSDGSIVSPVTVNVTGSTIGDMVSALNTAFAGNATFSLDSNGQLQMTTSAANSGDQLLVTDDSTERGSTGESFSSLFGLGATQSLSLAQTLTVNPALTNSPAALTTAQPTLTSTTALGANVVGSGDNSGLLALQNALTQQQTFAAAGSLTSQSTSLDNYAAAFYQDVATRASDIQSQQSAQDTRLSQAQQQQSQSEGVNLDTELENMMTLQQAYSAGARLLSVAQQAYTDLYNAVSSGG